MKHSKRISIFIFTFILTIGFSSIQTFAATVPTVTHLATINAGTLRLRSGPSTNHATIGYAPQKDYVTITGKTGEWYRVEHNLRQGYMHEKYLKTHVTKNVELGYGTVTANRVNFRTGPGTDYRSVAKANVSEQAYVIGFNQQWYKVIYKDLICYIRSDYLKLTEVPYENQASTNKPLFFVDGKSTGILPSAEALNRPNNSTIRSLIISEAKKYLGTPYVWGGTSPEGFDCSGYVQYVMMKNGISIPRTTLQQVETGRSISKNDLQPGDLVFLQNTYREGVSHVGIYIGNNQMIHASSSKGVTVSNLLSTYYMEHYHSARQLIN